MPRPTSPATRTTSRFFSAMMSEIVPVSSRTRGAKRALSSTVKQENPTTVNCGGINDELPALISGAVKREKVDNARDPDMLMASVKQEINDASKQTLIFPKKRGASASKLPKSKSKLKPQIKSKSKKSKTLLTKAETLAKFKDKPTVKGPFKEPLGWVDIWDTMTHLRAARNAPVDEMVPDDEVFNKDNPKWKYTRHDKHYHDLISLMLSSQTRDTVNIATMGKLREFGLTVDRILATDDEVLKALINKVGFYNRKTIYIKQATRIIKNEHNGRVPDSLEALLKLPGVGPKMAYLALSHSFKKHLGIGVDTHVHRISNQLQWARGSTPEATRKHLQSWLPQDRWFLINFLMVGIGQQIQQPLERPKVLKQCLSHPNIDAQCAGLRLLEKLGFKVEAEAAKGELKLPQNWSTRGAHELPAPKSK